MALYAEFCFLPINIIQQAEREKRERHRQRQGNGERERERERLRVDNYISKSEKLNFLLSEVVRPL